MIILSLKVSGVDHLIAWDNKNKKPEPGASLMPPAEFETFLRRNYPKMEKEIPAILDLVKRKGTSFPNPEKDVDFCLNAYTYVKRGNKGGRLTREEFVNLYGPKVANTPQHSEDAEPKGKGKGGKG